MVETSILRTAAGVCATTSNSGLGLSFITEGNTGDIPLGMIVLDASDPNNLTWTDKTHGTLISTTGPCSMHDLGTRES